MSRRRPDPEEMLEVLRRIEALAPTVEDDFNQLHGFAWSAKGSWGEKVRAPRPDPTGSVATHGGEQAAARGITRRVFRMAEQALTLFEKMAQELDDGFGDNWETAMHYPYHHKITPQEQAASRDAQARRRRQSRGKDSALMDPGQRKVAAS